MNAMKKYFAAIILFPFLFSCGNSKTDVKKDSAKDSLPVVKNLPPENSQLVTGEDFEMCIPKNYSPTNDLNKNAVLQYSDTTTDKYVIVMSEIKDDFMRDMKDAKVYDEKLSLEKNYRTAEMKMMASGVTMKETPEIKSVKINGREAEIADVIGTVNEIDYDVFYKVAFIAGEKKLYMIMSWTIAGDREKNDSEMEAMLNSFKVK